jgi:hypothetical protein
VAICGVDEPFPLPRTFSRTKAHEALSELSMGMAGSDTLTTQLKDPNPEGSERHFVVAMPGNLPIAAMGAMWKVWACSSWRWSLTTSAWPVQVSCKVGPNDVLGASIILPGYKRKDNHNEVTICSSLRNIHMLLTLSL